jgi:hypothetical protein
VGYSLPDQTEYVCILYNNFVTGKDDKAVISVPGDTGIGSVTDKGRSDVSSPIRSIKMYSYAQCTMQERSVCCRDVPCLAHLELGSGPLHTKHQTPSLSAWGNRDSVYQQPSRRMDLDSGVEIRKQPDTDPVISDNVC